MSGSPIIQNGKLVGAVTHVLIDNSKCGYGIFAETMLESAQSVAEEQLKKRHNIKTVAEYRNGFKS